MPDGISQQAITQELRRRIQTAQYVVGQRIPPERELQQEFGCSRLTVAKAMAPLVADGTVRRHKGRGSFVVKGVSPTAVPVHGRPVARGNVIKYVSPGHETNVKSLRDDVLGSLHSILSPIGYHVSVDFYGSAEEHVACLGRVRDPQIAGAVLWPLPDPRATELIRELSESDVPIVLIDTYVPGVDCDYVVGDNIEGAAGMVAHLAGLGHRRICYLTRPPTRTSLRDRLSGFVRGMIEAGLPLGAESVVQVGSESDPYAGLGDALESVLSRPDPPTALFASHDSLAIAVRDWLCGRGYSIPGQIALAGYDGIDAALYGSPAITTMEQDFARMAADAARILLERFDGRPAALRHQRHVLPRLCVRGSTVSTEKGNAQ